ncbi:diaphanous FH3 domain-containing protein [Phthorimaea operculella]|nr:diaphanous FH3 domain-containing protein [Phthorimaea operculella]
MRAADVSARAAAPPLPAGRAGASGLRHPHAQEGNVCVNVDDIILLHASCSRQRRLYLQAELEQAGFDILTLKMVSSMRAAVAGLAFINALLTSAPAPQRRLYLQAELEQAGFDILTLKKAELEQAGFDILTLKKVMYHHIIQLHASCSGRAGLHQRAADVSARAAAPPLPAGRAGASGLRHPHAQEGNVSLTSSSSMRAAVAGLAFINALLTSAPAPQRRLYLQAELEQAGFDILTLKKMISKLPQSNEQVLKELENYEKQLIDIDTLSEKAHEAQKEKDDLRHKLELLEKRVKILQEEKGILLSLEQCLKEKCCELQEEVSSLRSEHGNSNRKKSFAMKKKNSVHKNRDESSPPEDEGISSSERSLSPEGDPQRESMVYEVFNVKNETYDLMRNKRTYNKKMDTKNDKKSSDEEDETTIDEVIQELRNIVNHAESEQYAKERAFADDKSSHCNQTSEINVSVKGIECHKHRDADQEDSITSTRHSIQITSSNEFLDEHHDEDEESEIVPIKIKPHPPRKAKSLVHLFVPQVEQGLLYNKPPDLYDDTFYSSDEGSDSLLSASRCINVTKNPSNSSFDFNQRRAMFMAAEKEREEMRNKRSRTRSREECRRAAVKRSESFQTSEKGSRQREYIDSMFHTETYTSLIGSTGPLQRSNSKGSKVDEIVSLIESKKLTKSLDRIDEGLNSMVDIVMLSEPKKPSWPYERRQRSCSRTSSEAGKETPLVPVRTNSKITNFNSRYDRTSPKSKDETPKSEQKFYLPHPKLSTGSFENGSYSNPSFIVKRGHSNAGFYSGAPAPLLRDAPASMTSLGLSGSGTHSHTHGHADLKRALSPMSGSFGAHKVTDMPSGLY